VIGLPFDGGSFDRPGCAQAPTRLRVMSANLNQAAGGFWDYARGEVIFADLSITDLGDLVPKPEQSDAEYLALAEAAARATLSEGKRLLALGGDHLVTLGLVRGALSSGPIQVVQVDAHSDIQPHRPGARPTHGNFMGCLLAEPDLLRVVQIGVRGWGRTAPSRDEKVLRARPSEVSDRLLPGIPVYLTVDTDGLDPMLAPAVSHPVPRGLDLDDLQQILMEIEQAGATLIAADWTEFNPVHDTENGIGGRTVLTGIAMIVEHWERRSRRETSRRKGRSARQAPATSARPVRSR
jgi:arginase family enzyme